MINEDARTFSPQQSLSPQLVINATIVWHLILSVVLVIVAWGIFTADQALDYIETDEKVVEVQVGGEQSTEIIEAGERSWGVFSAEQVEMLGKATELGRPVQVFIALLVLTPVVVGLIASFLMLRRNNRGRYLILAINFTGAILSLFVMLSLWGVYNSFELIVDGIMLNAPLLLVFVIAFIEWLIVGRFVGERDDLRFLYLGLALISSAILAFALAATGADSRQASIDLFNIYALFFFIFALASFTYWFMGKQDYGSVLRLTLRFVSWGLLAIPVLYLLHQFNVEAGIIHILNTYANIGTWLITVAAIIFAVLAWLILYQGEYFGETPDQREAWQGWLMLSPNIIGFMLFFTGPLLLSFYLSFTDSHVGSTPEVIGFENYANILDFQFISTDDTTTLGQNLLDEGYEFLAEWKMGGTRTVFGAQDRMFWVSLRNTLIFCIMLLPMAIAPAMLMALILNSKLPGVKFFRAVYFLPSVAAVVGTALIWRWLYQPTEGFINHTLRSIATGLGLVDPNVQWLTDPNVVLFSIVILSAWQVVGYNTVLFLAGLQGIPNVLYEAAMIDGADRWQQFRNVTLPMLAPTSFFVVITTMVTGLQVFNEPYALFPAQPIPENATTSVYYLYRQGFSEFQFGYASSVAWVLFAIIFGLTLLQFRLNRGEAYD